jgi:hypothetical protein
MVDVRVWNDDRKCENGGTLTAGFIERDTMRDCSSYPFPVIIFTISLFFLFLTRWKDNDVVSKEDSKTLRIVNFS